MEPNSSIAFFEYSDQEDSEPILREPELPPATAEGQHEVSARIANTFLEHFNDSIQSYLVAKNQHRYQQTSVDLFGSAPPVFDAAKNALFENLIWLFELRSFDRISFAACCHQADDDHFGDPESIRFFIAKNMRDELLELLELIASSVPKQKYQRISQKLSEYITCPQV